MALFVEWFWVRKFLFLFEGVDIICQWGSDDDAPGCFLGIPKFRDIPLGSAKVPDLGCYTLRGGFLVSFEGSIVFID